MAMNRVLWPLAWGTLFGDLLAGADPARNQLVDRAAIGAHSRLVLRACARWRQHRDAARRHTAVWAAAGATHPPPRRGADARRARAPHQRRGRPAARHLARSAAARRAGQAFGRCRTTCRRRCCASCRRSRIRGSSASSARATAAPCSATSTPAGTGPSRSMCRCSPRSRRTCASASRAQGARVHLRTVRRGQDADREHRRRLSCAAVLLGETSLLEHDEGCAARHPRGADTEHHRAGGAPRSRLGRELEASTRCAGRRRSPASRCRRSPRRSTS